MQATGLECVGIAPRSLGRSVGFGGLGGQYWKRIINRARFCAAYYFSLAGMSGFDPPTNSFLPSLNVTLLPLARMAPFLA